MVVLDLEKIESETLASSPKAIQTTLVARLGAKLSTHFLLTTSSRQFNHILDSSADILCGPFQKVHPIAQTPHLFHENHVVL